MFSNQEKCLEVIEEINTVIKKSKYKEEIIKKFSSKIMIIKEQIKECSTSEYGKDIKLEVNEGYYGILNKLISTLVEINLFIEQKDIELKSEEEKAKLLNKISGILTEETKEIEEKQTEKQDINQEYNIQLQKEIAEDIIPFWDEFKIKNIYGAKYVAKYIIEKQLENGEMKQIEKYGSWPLSEKEKENFKKYGYVIGFEIINAKNFDIVRKISEKDVKIITGECGKLYIIKLNEGIEEIGDYCFYNHGLREFTAPSTLKKIGIYSFYRNGNLTQLKLNEGVEKIGERCFLGCDIRKLTTPSTLKWIGIKAFRWNRNLTELKLNEGLEVIEKAAFEKCDIRKLTTPSTLKKIGILAFQENKNLAELKLNEGLEEIGWTAFFRCDIRETTPDEEPEL